MRIHGRLSSGFFAIGPRLPAVTAIVLALLILRKAITEIDPTWDSLAYHIPFEALRIGILKPSQYAFAIPGQGYAYDGFPAIGDVIRGLFWKLSGRVEAVNLLSLISLLCVTGYVRWAYRISWAWVFLALLAIPQVQTTAAGNYIDLSANCFYTIMLLSVCELYVCPEKFERPARWAVLFLSAFLGAHMKLQVSIFVVLTLPFIAWPAWTLVRTHAVSGVRLLGLGMVSVAALLMIGENFLKNLLKYGNPFYPVNMDVGPLRFPGPFGAATWWDIPLPLRNMAQPLRWLLSLLEYRSLGPRFIPYTNGMGDVPSDGWSSRMGGYYGALVVASVCFLFVGISQKRDRCSTVFLICFLVLSVILSLFPNSQELRYEMFWMMFLVISCLILLQRLDLMAYLNSYRIVCAASLIFVTSVTGGMYFTLSDSGGLSMKQLLAHNPHIAQKLNATVQAGDTLCLEGWDPYTVLFAPIFHPDIAKDRPYSIQEGRNNSCAGKKTILKSP